MPHQFLHVTGIVGLGRISAVTGEINAIVERDGAGSSQARQGGFPGDILGGIPLRREIFCLAHGRTGWASELRPVCCQEAASEKT